MPGTKHRWRIALGGASKVPKDVQKGRPGGGAAPPSVYPLIPLSTCPSMCSPLVDTVSGLLNYPSIHPPRCVLSTLQLPGSGTIQMRQQLPSLSPMKSSWWTPRWTGDCAAPYRAKSHTPQATGRCLCLMRLPTGDHWEQQKMEGWQPK